MHNRQSRPGRWTELVPRDVGWWVLAAALPLLLILPIQWLSGAAIAPSPWLLFVPAIVVGAWLGGFPGGVGATVVSAALASWLFLAAEHAARPRGFEELLAAGTFVVTGIAVSFLQGRLRQASREAAAGRPLSLHPAGRRMAGPPSDLPVEKEALERLRELEERFRLTIDEAPIGMALVALDGRFMRVNRVLCEIVGYAPEELTGLTFQAITHPEDLETDLALARRLIAGEIPRYQLEKRYIRKDGTIVDVLLSASILRGEGGEARHYIAQIEDISERKRAQEALRRSEERLSLAVQGAGIGLWDWDVVADEAHLSARYWELIGRRGREEPANLAFFKNLVHPEDRPAVDQVMREHLQGQTAQSVVDFRARLGSGEYAWFSGIGHVTARDPKGAPQRMLGIILDIAERKRREVELGFLVEAGATFGESLDHPHTLAVVADLAVRRIADWCVIDLVKEDGRIERMKVACADPAAADLATALERVVLDRSRPSLARAAIEGRRSILIEHVTTRDLETFAQNPEHLHLLSALGAVSVIAVPLLLHGEAFGALILGSSTPSRAYRTHDLRLAEALADRAAAAIENTRLYRASVEATRLRDEVLGIVAHDLRNPLGTILGQAVLLQRQAELPAPRTRRAAELIGRAATRMDRLIRDLLDVTHLEAGGLSVEPARLGVTDLVIEAVELQRSLATTSGVELRTDLARHTFDILGDRDRLMQAFENLIGNAIKFSKEGGRITVGTTQRDEDIVFRVTDDGCGIATEDLPHVFDRFWQASKARRIGAGLGLAITRGIVEAHGGRIWVESTPGRGSTFFFSIPRAGRAKARTTARLH